MARTALFLRRTQNAIAHHRRRAREARSRLDYGLDDLRDLVAAALDKPCPYCRAFLTDATFMCDHQDATTLAIDMETKRPDFTLVSLAHKLHIVEIKRPNYSLGDADAERLLNYLDVFDAFFDEHRQIQNEFPDGYDITLIVDAIGSLKSNNRRSIEAAKRDKKLEHVRWKDFLLKSMNAHQQFLDANDAAEKKKKK